MLVERNWRSAQGEIDLIARDGDWLVFVEVKTRNGTGYGHPFEAITQSKITKIRGLVAEWCSVKHIFGARIRLDAIAVLVSSGKVHIEHLKEVF